MLNATAPKRSSSKSHTTTNVPLINKSDIMPVIVPRTSMRSEPVADSRKEVGVAGTTVPFSLQPKALDTRKFPNTRDDVDKLPFSPVTESAASMSSESSGYADKNNFPASVCSTQGIPTSKKGLKYATCLGTGKYSISLTELSARNQLEVFFKSFIHVYACFQ